MILRDLTDKELNELARQMEPHIQELNQRDADVKNLDYRDILHLIKVNIAKNNYFTTNSDQDTQNKLTDLSFDFINDKVATYFNIAEIMSGSHILQTIHCNLPFEEFLDINKLDDINSEQLMFDEWILPIMIDNQKYIIEQISGQGETFITIGDLPEIYPAITKWYDFKELLETPL